MTTLSYTYERAGVAADAYSVEFSNSDATIGVRRTDTAASVVAAGTALDHDGTGEYSYEITDPAVDLTYEYWLKIYDDAADFSSDLPLYVNGFVGSHTAWVTSSQLFVLIGDYLGWGRSGWTSEQEARLGEIINAAYRQFLYPPILPGDAAAHHWSFLRPKTTLDTVAADYLYDMPSNFGAIVGEFYYDEGESTSFALEHVSPGKIDKMRSEASRSERPKYFALRPKSVAQTAQQVTELMLYPTPGAVYTLHYYYDVLVAELSSSTPYPLGGPAHEETLIQSCRDIAATRYKDEPGSREHDLFMQRLQASVEYDRRQSPDYIGTNSDGRGMQYYRHGTEFAVSLRHNLGGG